MLRKEEINLSLFSIQLKTQKIFTNMDKLLELINEFSKGAGFKTNIEKSIVFLNLYWK